MVTLTERAERAALGTLLYRPSLMEDVVLRPDDFASEQNARVFEVLTEARNQHGPEARASIASRANVPESYLAALKASPPDLNYGETYQFLVGEAAALRRLRGITERLDARAARLKMEAESASRLAAIGLHLQAQSAHEQASALQADCAWFDPDRMSGIVARRSPASAEELVEQKILGALITEHPESNQVLETLAPEHFNVPLNRDIYEQIYTLHMLGSPVDSLIVDWSLRRQHGAAPEHERLGQPGGDDPPTYVTRLASLPPWSQVMPAAEYLAGRELSNAHRRAPAPPSANPVASSGPSGRLPWIDPPPPAPGTGPAPRPER